jgi:hypothetical protein
MNARSLSMKHHTGSCLCGGVRFTLTGPIAPIQVCHCMQCRKAQGTAIATNVPVEASHFRLEQGDGLLSSYESSPGKQRVFCRVCGSPIYSQRDTVPGVLRVRLGLINEPVDAPLQAHFFTGSKANWWPICDELPQFAAGLEPPKVP